MASSNKTAHYLLNQWKGTDCPKRVDFNADNELIDAALYAHAANTSSHLSLADRTKLDSLSASGATTIKLGSYLGNGSTQTVNPGFTPKYVKVWRLSYPPISVTDGQITVNCGESTGTLTQNGVELITTGFVVKNTTLEGVSCNLNQTNALYYYICF